MIETCAKTAVSQVRNFVDAQILFIAPVEAHFGREVEAHAKKLRKGINVVCQAFLPVVFIDFIFIETFG